MPDANPIQDLLLERGPVSFRDFMALALYHPRYGYYASGRAAPGRHGDFFTSVSVGPLFGRLLALQALEMWDFLGRPSSFTLVEQGAHDGALAADLLGWLQAHAPEFLGALRYTIIEPFPILAARQRARLASFADDVEWIESIERLAPFTGLHLSNELVDAFPVHRVRFRDGQWHELWVTPDLEWTGRPVADPALAAALGPLPRIEGYTTEISLDAPAWARALAPRLERGWVLVIDYGYPAERYYDPARTDGTLQCYREHKRGLDPLQAPGSCDITAHVEFTGLARAFLSAGLTLDAFTDQHHFLTGLAARAFTSTPPTPRETSALKTLLHPEMLGAAFQVLALSRAASSSSLSGLKFARPCSL